MPSGTMFVLAQAKAARSIVSCWVGAAGLSVLAVACSAGGDAPGGQGGGFVGASSASGGNSGKGGTTLTASDVVGTFTVQIVTGAVTVGGSVKDGPMPPQPTLILGEPTAASNDANNCQLYPTVSPSCSPVCNATKSVCVATNRCQPYPTVQSVGTVQVSGIRTATGDTQFSMAPMTGSNMYGMSGASPPFPGAFNEGDLITLTAEGSAFVSPFTLASKGIAKLSVSEATVHLARDTPVAVHWTPAAQPGVSSVETKIDISHHGGTTAQIKCTSADSGSVEIAGSLVSGLLDLGYHGGNAAVITRRSLGETQISTGGTVQLDISSEVQIPITIEGQIVCDEQTPCPTGKTCTLYQCL